MSDLSRVQKEPIKLTKRLVDSIKSPSKGEKEVLVHDALIRGFALRLRPGSQNKSFIVHYRIGGRRGRLRKVTIGPYGIFTVEQAREQARQILAMAKRGEDPAEFKASRRTDPTMNDLWERYLHDYAEPRKKAGSIREDVSIWTNHISPAMANLLVADVSRSDVAKLHSKMHKTPTHANRARALLSKMMNLAEDWRLREDNSNPCKHIKPYKEKKRERYMTGEEYLKLGQALVEMEEQRELLQSAAAAIRVLALTGCRLNEIIRLKWVHIDDDAGLIRLPDSKTGAKQIYLTKEIIKILETIEPSSSEWVFPGTKEENPVTLYSVWPRLMKRAGIKNLRIHDLRHSHASIGVAEGYSLPVLGKLLGHSQMTTTERYAHLSDNPLREAAKLISSKIAQNMSSKTTILAITDSELQNVSNKQKA
jgi:integrase